MPQTIDYPNDYQDDIQYYEGEDVDQQDIMEGADDYM
jgi:hypothetical protein